MYPSLFNSTPSAVTTSTPAQPAPVAVAESPAARLQQLRDIMPRLSSRDQAFAADLLRANGSKWGLSAKQWPWVETLILKAIVPQASGFATVTVGDFSAVLALFTTARAKLKFPKVRLLMADGTPVILSMAGPNSSAPGTINVAGEGQYPDRTWYGRVNADGAWSPARNIRPEVMTALTTLLTSFGQAPADIATAYGRATNSCCFCARELTDARSVAAGFGPICAGHYGLSAQWEAAANPLAPYQGELGGVLD